MSKLDTNVITPSRNVMRSYVYESNGNHVRLEFDGVMIRANAFFDGRVYSFCTDLHGAALLKKAINALLCDEGA